MTDEADDTTPSQHRSLVGQVADCFVYAPLGLAFDARDLFPTLVEKGRNQVMVAKMLGRFAVQQGTQVGRSAVIDLGTQAVSLLPGVDLDPNRVPADEDTDDDTVAGTSGADDLRSDEVGSDDGRSDDGRSERSGVAAGDAAATAASESPLTSAAAPAADEEGFVAVPAEDAAHVASSSSAVPVDVTTLAIPDYDSLSALQVVPRLDGLTTSELEAVGLYEAATRGRKTILNKVAQLQSS